MSEAPRRNSGESAPDSRRRKLIVGGAAALGLGAIEVATGAISKGVKAVFGSDENLECAPEKSGDGAGAVASGEFFPEASSTGWDDNPEYFRKFPNGQFSRIERFNRTKRLPNGEIIFRDVGMEFYEVRRGDTISGIRKKLARYPRYAHLKMNKHLDKLESFNIPARELQEGMLLPIPLERNDRILTDEQFANYCSAALAEIESHPKYGKYVKGLIDAVGQKEVVAVMLAIAKNESGGKPLGQYEFHRWEPDKDAFSFSICHVVMQKGSPGLRARQSLDMTEGQTYHPKNAVKLFMGFLIEKIVMERGEKLTDYFPLPEHWEDFASMYNGKKWKTRNPRYVKLLKRYYGQAVDLLDNGDGGDEKIAKTESEEVEEREETPQSISKTREVDGGFVQIGDKNLRQTVFDANWLNKERPIKLNRDVKAFSKRIIRYLKMEYRDTSYLPTDQISVGKDEHGVFVVFKRGAKGATLRL